MRQTKSGLLVVTKDEQEAVEEMDKMLAEAADLRKKSERRLRWRGSRHHEILGIDIKTEARMETPHKLNEEQRKQRREDNKAMREIRKKTRGRKKHGRTR